MMHGKDVNLWDSLSFALTGLAISGCSCRFQQEDSIRVLPRSQLEHLDDVERFIVAFLFEKGGNKDDLDHEIDVQESIPGSSIFSTIQINNGSTIAHVPARAWGEK